MKKKVLTALTISLLALSGLSLSFAKSGSVNLKAPTANSQVWDD